MRGLDASSVFLRQESQREGWGDFAESQNLERAKHFLTSTPGGGKQPKPKVIGQKRKLV